MRKNEYLSLVIFVLILMSFCNANAQYDEGDFSTPPVSSEKSTDAEGDVLRLPKGLAVIDAEAFYGDTALSSVFIPDGVEGIESMAFADSGVKSVSLPSSLSYLAEDAFAGCSEDLRITRREEKGPYGIYGIRFRRNDSSPTVERAYDAEGMIYRQQTGNSVKYSDFDLVFPWGNMRECNITTDSSGTGIVYEGEPGFSRTEKNTFIEVPAFFFRRSVVDDTEEWCISAEPFDGAEIEPWFINPDGSVAEHRYIAKYEGAPISTDFVSVSGVYPDTASGYAAYSSHCQSHGFKLMSIQAHLALAHLMTIESGTFFLQNINSGISFLPYSMHNRTWNLAQNTETGNEVVLPHNNYKMSYVNIGDTVYLSNISAHDASNPRIVESIDINADTVVIRFSGKPYPIQENITRCFPAMQLTGRTDAMSYFNGRPIKNKRNSAFQYRGIENIYGNIWEYADGAQWHYSSGKYTIGNTETSFSAPYQPFTGADDSCQGFIKTLGFDPSMPWATLPETVGGKPNTFITDEWNNMGNGENQIFAVSGGWDHMNANGMFNIRTVTPATFEKHSVWLYGYRAMF